MPNTLLNNKAEFPIDYAYFDCGNPLFTSTTHWHCNFEIIHVISDEITVSINDNEYIVKEGEYIFINSGFMHSISAKVHAAPVYESISFDFKILERNTPDIMQSVIQGLSNQHKMVSPMLDRICCKMFVEIVNTLKELFRLASNYTPDVETYAIVNLYLLFADLYANNFILEGPDKNNNDFTIIKRVINYIEENYNSHITLDDLSTVANLSSKYLCRFFKKYTNKTPINYLNAFRLERACLMLDNGTKSVTEIAFDCGFNDLSFFIKSFREQKGFSPTKYIDIGGIEGTKGLVSSSFQPSPQVERFRAKRWGCFVHYLYSVQNSSSALQNPSRKVTDWNTCVNEFDTEKFAYTMHKVGASYVFFTLLQSLKWMCAPNKVYDEISGCQPGENCSVRDLPADLIKSLKKYDIDLFLYYTADGPYYDSVVGKKIGMPNPRLTVTETFLKNWSAVLEELAVRYGEDVTGWYIDGCYSWLGYNDENIGYFERAIKKGNPNALISCSHGSSTKFMRRFKCEDFTTGDMNDFDRLPPSRFVTGGVQSHVLAPLGTVSDGSKISAWSYPGCKHNAQYMLNYIRKADRIGTIVTMDTLTYRDGSINPEQEKLLQYIGDNL